jgi:hypothetical protein
MKELLLVLLLLTVAGCEDWERINSPDGKTQIERTKESTRIENLKSSLKDGRVHVGMTTREFSNLWGTPPDQWIDRSTSAYGTTEWWKFDDSCKPCGYGRYDNPKYHFCFENGILTYWSEN